MSDELAVREEHQVMNIEDYAMSADRLMSQVKLIQSVMKNIMQENEHYGTIPGCKKPSLWKPGAEKLCMTFRFAPSFETIGTNLSAGHREYTAICTLTHIPTGTVVAQGMGLCTTMEGKYRFRVGEVKPTGKAVPQAYWNDRDQELIGGKGFSVKKIDGKYQIVEIGERVEHDNPADYYNTVLKMAIKRAMIAATLSATAASDIFEQDIADEDGTVMGVPVTQPKKEPAPDMTPKTKEAEAGDIISEGQKKMLEAKIKDAQIDRDEFKQAFDLTHIGDLLKKDMNAALDWLKDRKAERANG